jgi:peptidylprolyl isomerase
MTIELPQATGSFGDKPQITFPAGGAPEGLHVQVLSQGDGAEVAAGDNIVVHYLGQSWDGGVFDNSYDRGATIDFPIGSRLLLSIPPELGYGSRGVPQAGIGPGATLVFVVDIVGVG